MPSATSACHASRRAFASPTGPSTRSGTTCSSQRTSAETKTASMERALLARHAESVLSARGIANGRVDVRCPLSARGVAQARSLAEELADEEIDLCVTSE